MNHGLPQFAEACFTFAAQLIKRHPQRTTALVTALLLGGTGATFAVANLAPDASELPVRTLVENVQTLPVQAQTAAMETLALRLYRSDTTRSTDTAETLLNRLGVFDPQAAAFLRSDAQSQQGLLGRAGRNVTVETSENNALLSLSARWSPDDSGMFKRLTVESTPAGFRSRTESLPLTATSRLASGTIKSSLFAATDDARIPDSIATQLAEIFSGDIDFHRALRKGDRFSVVYETLEGDGEPMRAGRVLSAEFVNAGKTHQAMWFQEPLANGNSASGATTHAPAKGGYYTLAGQSLRRAFLASPMEFSRITSGFKMRFHPILRTWRAHNGVDYAAPTGTPVRSVGEGVVDFAGVQSGYGNVVMVKHNNSDTTVYAHLSRINVKRGEQISQGQHIGAVGSTGWATGPHLHFEFRINGVFRDPLAVASRNTTVPVSASAKPLFDKAASQVRSQLAAAAQTQLGTAQ